MPAPLSLRKKKSTTALSPVRESSGFQLQNRAPRARQKPTPKYSPFPTYAELNPPRPQPLRLQSGHGKPQVEPQVKPHSTQTSPGNSTERSISEQLPPRISSLHAPDPTSPTHNFLPPTRINTRTPNYSLPTSSNTALLGSFDKDLPSLPRHIQPEGRYKPRSSPDTSRYFSSPVATTSSYGGEAQSITDTPAKLSQLRRTHHQEVMSQGISRHHSPGSVSSFKDKNKTLETDIVSLLDNMSHGVRPDYPPPPCPPPNYPPPPPPSKASRRQSQQSAKRASGSNQSANRLSGSQQSVNRLSGSQQIANRVSAPQQSVNRLSGYQQSTHRISESQQSANRLSGSQQPATRVSGSQQSAYRLSGSQQSTNRASGSLSSANPVSGYATSV